MARGRTVSQLVVRHEQGDAKRGPDRLVVEEPLEIRLDGVKVATTMRTPGDDYELAVGFCHTEGLLSGAPVRRVRYCATGSAMETAFNVVTVDTGGVAPVPAPRLTTTTSSCGWCGTDAIDDVAARVVPLEAVRTFPADVLIAVPEKVRAAQELFDLTGGVHAAAAFDGAGDPLIVREDIGRHNAVDKVVGKLVLDGRLPASDLGLFVSGRTSFEIIQKAWAAGMPAVVSVSAPSSLAVEAARRAGIMLAGFARPGRLNVYTP
ncbi:MAG: formate dehydrogenase accessory sulfurtransferase FdhD [Acidimicrobiales bacterium]|nr:formate dehydrogenase accessory sulfurtransferase FdhD [Acidimicrobiales bacterium]